MVNGACCDNYAGSPGSIDQVGLPMEYRWSFCTSRTSARPDSASAGPAGGRFLRPETAKLIVHNGKGIESGDSGTL